MMAWWLRGFEWIEWQLVRRVGTVLAVTILITALAAGWAMIFTAAASPAVPVDSELQMRLRTLEAQYGAEIIDRIKADAAIAERLATLDARLQGIGQLLWLMLGAFIANIAVAITTWMKRTGDKR